ncbi:MAG: 4-alpha-glucanotransferase [Erythrobacter sp.]|jgi:4-alpha-glucanotransferase|nr:4-alpha-glucanotransferase [Erythrobacter sp.]
MSTLEELAREAGLFARWEDAAGQPQEVSAGTLERVLAALGLPASTQGEIDASRRRLVELRSAGARRFLTAQVGEPIALPEGLEGPLSLILENGEARGINAKEGLRDGIGVPGYHRLLHAAGETMIAVAPSRCRAPGDVLPGGRGWGVTVQIPSLRGSRADAFGHLGTLAQTAQALGRAGADLLAISPVHALFPADPRRYSPYSPSSRRMLNGLLCDPARAGREGDQDMHTPDLVDWESAIPARLAQFRRQFDAASPEERRRIACAPPHVSEHEIDRHALHEALHAHFAAQGHHGWRAWPKAYRRPDAPAALAFAADHPEEIAFHRWLQGLAHESLLAAQDAALGAGMHCGLVTDLAVGVDPGGADLWTRPEAFLEGLSVGAPPDLLGPDGQDWGLTTFNPLALHADGFRAFRETLAAAMAQAGGVRIDHALGLSRIWVVPLGQPSSQGCYLAMPRRDLLNVLALESWRHDCIVIGEDLGTVPAGLRDELRERHICGMRVLWFERGKAGNFTDPADWTREAAAMTSTHDLPTLAGWWQGRDLDWACALDRGAAQANEVTARSARESEKADLWNRIGESGHAIGPPPADPEPFVTAAIAHVAGSACELALVPLEDLIGLAEQPNLPGTLEEHPNWRRRMPKATSALLERREVSERIAALTKGRNA